MKTIIKSALLVFLCLTTLACSFGCRMRAYACEIIGDEFTSTVKSKDFIAKEQIDINHKTYSVEYSESKKCRYTNRILDDYEIVGDNANPYRGLIRIDAESGALIGFWNINPFPTIESIKSEDEAGLREAVETVLRDLDDFSKYNSFSVERINDSVSKYSLICKVKRDLVCNISAIVYLTENGEITGFCKTDACPDDLAESFIDPDERNRLLEKEICKYINCNDIKQIRYEIRSETLTYYNGFPAVSYIVEIIDDGFAQVKNLVIYS